jgi:BirA family biotin operon repressor/biotin-[acetyl-CoA-carboxylase] ligase
MGRTLEAFFGEALPRHRDPSLGGGPLAALFFSTRPWECAALSLLDANDQFPFMIIQQRSDRSNLETLSDLLRRGIDLPDGLVCVAAAGEGFLGRHDRTWHCEEGNLHAVIYLKPKITPERAGAAFSILAAVACLDAILAQAPPARAPMLKWVNDVYVGRRKVAGTLTRQTFQEPNITDVLLGIGVNVLKDPCIAGNPFIPGSGCLREVYPESEWYPGRLLKQLLLNLKSWYEKLLHHGPSTLLDHYRRHCGFIGKSVRIYEDGYGFFEDDLIGRKEIGRGTVASIRDDLSLELDGKPEPISMGRLAFTEDCPE